MEAFGFDLADSPPRVHDICLFLSDDPVPEHQSPVPPPAFKKAKWSTEEDELLRQFVEIHGLGNWSVIAQNIPGRNGKQCRERWMNQLCPALNKDNWSPQEDAILLQQQRIFGNVWSQIAQFLPGRSPNSVKNRWSWLSRHTVSPAFAAQMMPFIVQHSHLGQHRRGGQEFTAPPNLQWQLQAMERGRTAFSDPGQSAVNAGANEESEIGMFNLFPDPRNQADHDDEKDEFVRRFEDWVF
jgi:hypothetical protein